MSDKTQPVATRSLALLVTALLAAAIAIIGLASCGDSEDSSADA